MLLVLSTAVSLSLVEGLTRFYLRFFKPNIMILDEEIGWTNRPNAYRTYEVEGHVAAVETNELGLRGTVYRGAPTNPRILFLGDSFAAGMEVSNDELFSELLDRSHPDVDVVNGGIAGYGTLQHIMQARRLEPIVQPDHYVLMVFPNDLTDNIIPFSDGIGPRPYVSPEGDFRAIDWEPFDPLLLPVPFARWCHRNSQVAYLIRNRFWFPMRKEQLGVYVADRGAAVEAEGKWQLLEALVGEFAEGREVTVLGLPRRETAQTVSEFSQRLRQVAERVGVRFVDLHPVLRAEHFYERDIHWNAAGHRAVAEHLSTLVNSGLLGAADVARMPFRVVKKTQPWPPPTS